MEDNDFYRLKKGGQIGKETSSLISLVEKKKKNAIINMPLVDPKLSTKLDRTSYLDPIQSQNQQAAALCSRLIQVRKNK